MYQPLQFGVQYAIEEIVVAQLKALGFVDTSLGNNLSPSFMQERPLDKNIDLWVIVWIDAQYKVDREFPEAPRFLLEVKEEGGSRQDEIIQTDDFWVLLDFIRKTLVREKFPIYDPEIAFVLNKADLAACYTILIGYDPFEKYPAITQLTVARMLMEYLEKAIIESTGIDDLGILGGIA